MNDNTKRPDGDANRDPFPGAPGLHPVGTGLGAIAGPIGIVIGTAVGGLAGKAAAAAIDPTREHAYWRENYRASTYVEPTPGARHVRILVSP